MNINKIINESINSVLTEGTVSDLKEKAGDVANDAKVAALKAGKKVVAGAEDLAGSAKEAALKAGEKVGEVGEDVKEKAVGMGKKALSAVQEHPGIAAAVAAALAAGVGGLALRKRLKAAAKK